MPIDIYRDPHLDYLKKAAWLSEAELAARHAAGMMPMADIRAQVLGLPPSIADAVLGFDRRTLDVLSGLDPALTYASETEKAAKSLARSYLVDDIVNDPAKKALRACQEQVTDQLARIQEALAPQLQEIETFKQSAGLWAAGESWLPSTHSLLGEIDLAQSASINAMMDEWRDRLGYVETFSAIAGISDALSASGGSLNSATALFGDIRALTFGPDFGSSAEARLAAYRDVGFDPLLLKPHQQALMAMLSLNGFVDPRVWERGNGLIVPVKPLRMRQRLKALRPTRLHARAHREIGSLERWLREFIDEEMSFEYGAGWFRSRAPKKLIGRLERQTIGDDDEVNGVIVLDDADFAHYLEIILDDTHWDDVFSHILGDRDDTKRVLTLFKELRVAVNHYKRKEFTKADFAQLRLCVRWFEEKTDGVWVY